MISSYFLRILSPFFGFHLRMKDNEIFIKLAGKTLEAGFINSENSLLMLLFSIDGQFLYFYKPADFFFFLIFILLKKA